MPGNRSPVIILGVLVLLGLGAALFILHCHDDDPVKRYYSQMTHAQYLEPMPARDAVDALPVVVTTPEGGTIVFALDADPGRAVWYTAVDAAVRVHAVLEGISPTEAPQVRLFKWGTDISLHVYPEYPVPAAHRLGSSLVDTVLAVSAWADIDVEHILLPAELHADAGDDRRFTQLGPVDGNHSARPDDGIYVVRRVPLLDSMLLFERRPVDVDPQLEASARAEVYLGEMMEGILTPEGDAGWPVPPELEMLSVGYDEGVLSLDFNLCWWEADSPFARAARDCLALTIGQLPEVLEVRLLVEGGGDVTVDAGPGRAILEPVGDVLTVVTPGEIPGGEELGTVLMNAVGDVTLARGVREVMDERGEDHPFEHVTPIFQGGDLTFGNLEAPLADSGEPLPGKGIWLRGSPDSVGALHRAGMDVVNIANNHILDFGRPAFLETIAGLREWGILPVGGGSNDVQAHQPLFWEGRGVRIAFLAYAEHADIFWDWGHQETFAAGPDLPGVSRMDPDLMITDVRRAQEEADALVVSVHWGPEYVAHPPAEHRELALAVVREGADAVLGHHPHVLQSIEVHRGRPLLYSLGNFIYDQEPLRRAETVIAQLRWDYDDGGHLRPREIGFLPYRIREGQAVPASGEEIDSIFDYLVDISNRWNTDLCRKADVLYLDLSHPDR